MTKIGNIPALFLILGQSNRGQFQMGFRSQGDTIKLNAVDNTKFGDEYPSCYIEADEIQKLLEFLKSNYQGLIHDGRTESARNGEIVKEGYLLSREIFPDNEC